MKKGLSLLLALILMFSLAACRGTETPATGDTAEGGESTVDTDEGTEPDEGGEATEPEAGTSTDGLPDGLPENWKIGIITGTVSQGEEEFQAATNMIAKYGEDHIITATYPDKFSDEIETTISRVVSLADDPDVKAIVFVQAVPGATAAIEKVRETRPEMLFVCGVAQEAPRVIAEAADVVMLVDELGMGTAVIEQAAAMGATTFVHYSFPRHLGMETIAARTALFQENCARLDIEYVEATAPDPTGDAGVPGAQQFIREDVPRKLEQYGLDTAFFSTNCSMQEPLIDEVVNGGGIYPQQCCPSPYHGFPAAMNIETAGHEGDVQYMLDQISAKVDAAGASGRVSTWPLPVNMLMIEAGVEYCLEFMAGNTNGNFDDAVMRACINNVATAYNATETLSLYEDEDGEIDNFYMILCEFYNF